MVAALAAPATPAAYFEGWGREHACALDDLLLFARHEAHDLRRRSAESHLHRRFVLIVCLETAGTVSVDGIPFELKPLQAHLVFPQSYHYFQNLASSSLLWLFVTFETREGERLAPLRLRTLDLTSEDLTSLQDLVQRFSKGARKGRGDELSHRLSRFLCLQCERVLRRAAPEPNLPARPYSGLWRKFQVQLEKTPPEELRIAPLARRLGISDCHLRAKFQEQFGVSLGTYLRNYRITRAIALLTSSELSLMEIADCCGYGSPASFHRAFKQHTGVSPSEFRADPARHSEGGGSL